MQDSRPYLLSMGNEDGHFCGASLISPHAVLTAAHCVEGTLPTWVDFHRHDMRDDAGVVRMFLAKENDTIVMHPNWDTNTMEYDAAIIFLPDAVNDMQLLE